MHETIADFHHTPRRLAALEQAVAADAHNRAAAVAGEIAFVRERAGIVDRLVAAHAAGRIPERVTHNDTKLNNVMLDDVTTEGVCVIDLDTVMPGLSLYDFGDMVRTLVRPTAEDEANPRQLCVRAEMFEAAARGYLEHMRHLLTAGEREHLVFSARLITLEIGIRFLTDFLCGDVYFKTARPGQNLDRCRLQFALVRRLEEAEPAMTRVVEALL